MDKGTEADVKTLGENATTQQDLNVAESTSAGRGDYDSPPPMPKWTKPGIYDEEYQIHVDSSPWNEKQTA